MAIDVSDRLCGALLPFGLVVVGLSLLLLMVVFRSIAVPIKATLGYLLSVGASFGAVTAVFEWGWLAEPLNVPQTGPVISFMPIILMGVLFGLAMDYEVFLVSRMREEYVHTGDARQVVLSGFTGSARVVTAAAIIMISVFAAFVPHGDASVQPIALGLAVGVFVDAFLVRMTLVPAVLALLGTWAWWLPDVARPAAARRSTSRVSGIEKHVEHDEWVAEHGRPVVRAESTVAARRPPGARRGRRPGRCGPATCSPCRTATPSVDAPSSPPSVVGSTTATAGSWCSTGCCPPRPPPYAAGSRCTTACPPPTSSRPWPRRPATAPPPSWWSTTSTPVTRPTSRSAGSGSGSSRTKA